MHFTPYAIPSIVSALVLLTLFIYVLIYKRRASGAWQFLAMMVCCVIWASCYALSLLYSDANYKIFWYNLAQIGPDFSPIFWFLLTLEHIGRSDLLRRKWIAAFFAIPLLTTIFMWTNDWHHLLRRNIFINTVNDNLAYISTQRGPWYYIEILYAYIIIAVTLFLLFRFLKWSSSRNQTMVLIIGFMIPIFFNFLDILNISPFRPFGSTSIHFTITGVILSWGLFNQQLLDITPVARNKVLENIGDGVIVLDRHNRIVDANPVTYSMFGLDLNFPSTLLGKNIYEILPDWPQWDNHSALSPDTKIRMEISIKQVRRIFSVTVSSLFDKSGTFIGLVSIFHDITEQKEINERLRKQLDKINHLQNQLRDQALRDPLTNCFNRRYLEETLAHESSRADNNEFMVGLVMLDIDHFKKVNDTYGHAAGDQVLQTIGTLLQQNIRIGDITCRYGGEEFLIIFPGIAIQAAIERTHAICSQIAAMQVSAPSGAIIKVTVSAGIAIYPIHGNSMEKVLEHADQALYSAKHAGRNGMCVWDVNK